jgi:hypothetical protein
LSSVERLFIAVTSSLQWEIEFVVPRKEYLEEVLFCHASREPITWSNCFSTAVFTKLEPTARWYVKKGGRFPFLSFFRRRGVCGMHLDASIPGKQGLIMTYGGYYELYKHER